VVQEYLGWSVEENRIEERVEDAQDHYPNNKTNNLSKYKMPDPFPIHVYTDIVDLAISVL
jgi:hypothetical protein